jgi:hypothetical protein
VERWNDWREVERRKARWDWLLIVCAKLLFAVAVALWVVFFVSQLVGCGGSPPVRDGWRAAWSCIEALRVSVGGASPPAGGDEVAPEPMVLDAGLDLVE